ncbi:MAG: nuclear transport factor 2 family protein [Acidimicrobiia bacterium]|nr:nuclear transport factor 2 family protein [Acidimicrobiia bacterium]
MAEDAVHHNDRIDSDRIAIGDLLARYCDRLDAYDIDGVAACFTDDARADYGPGRGGEIVSRQAIGDRIRDGQAAFRRTHHQLGHSTITFDGTFDGDDPTRAAAVTAAMTWHERWAGERELLALRYVDELLRVDGVWLIDRRRVEISIVDGFEGTSWYWWPRREPVDKA